ncbi:MAG: hypothetical protein AAFY56_14925 [Pseudomonadota bacterium]
MRYEPFPIGVAHPVFDPGTYDRMLASYPPIERFVYLPKVGHKYSLSEKSNPKEFKAWIDAHPEWREFHRTVKRREFPYEVLETLRNNHVDLGIKQRSDWQQFNKRLRNLLRGRGGRDEWPLNARFEYSMLPADGGFVSPHTDSPGKIVTMVVSMVENGGWDTAIGGGTDINSPKKPELYFNEVNRRADFDDMNVLDTFEFGPNQCVMFIKTFNSWHSVRPMTAPGSKAMRKSLTINIEAGR